VCRFGRFGSSYRSKGCINGGFEDGFTDWEAVGDYRVETSTFGSEPVEGTSPVFYQQPLMKYLLNQPPQENAVPVTFVSGLSEFRGISGLSTFWR